MFRINHGQWTEKEIYGGFNGSGEIDKWAKKIEFVLEQLYAPPPLRCAKSTVTNTERLRAV